ncbi:MAG TPA: hypothetical protein VJV79_26460 [Polyangiaceae bacterium]|nr:hypothetical protein [Polyangiaceae bacterium]
MPLSPFRMSDGKIAKIKQAVLEQVERDDLEEAWRLSQPLLKVAREREAARVLSDLTRRGAFEAENGLVAARTLANAHPTDIEVLSNLGRAFERLHDIRYLNAAPPDDPSKSASYPSSYPKTPSCTSTPSSSMCCVTPAGRLGG